jgi:hypothetical protein
VNPAPALSEILVRADVVAAQAMIEVFTRQARFRIEPFDTRAAIEVAAMSRADLQSGRKRGVSDATWAKVKYDRQIVAIAAVVGAERIFTDDTGLQKLAKKANIPVTGVGELPLPADNTPNYDLFAMTEGEDA